ncbi:MAG: rhomboid family intramembrane serine protease [Lachnospiraceae bacterium]|nr:rhomboid family intramembrane serine protease [Lachnospiraceae bacterium]
MWDKLERKFGRFAIPRLMNYMVIGYVIGYLFNLLGVLTGINFLSYLTLDIYQITHITNGFPIPQFWRIVTWLIIPPDYNLLFGIIMMIFYWQLGTALERTWGTFRFNCYIFGGILFNILGAIILYFIGAGTPLVSMLSASVFTTNYINLSIFLAYALCYPEMVIYLYFIIPIKMKYMAGIWAVFTAFSFFTSGLAVKIQIVMSVLNFFIFYFSTRDYYRISPKERRRKTHFKKATSAPKGDVPKHKCCICGRTDITNPELQFRFCSKCNGNYEYCQDHLFTHVHKK